MFQFCVRYNENDVPIHATIHRMWCGYAERDDHNSHNWRDGFRTSYDAYEAATRLGVSAHPCQHCRPFDRHQSR